MYSWVDRTNGTDLLDGGPGYVVEVIAHESKLAEWPCRL
jgi:hypothetical protein